MEIINVQDLESRFTGIKINHFFTCASFEQRSSFLLRHVINTDIENFCVFATIDFDATIEQNRQDIFKLLTSRSYQSVDLKISDPVFSFINIVNYCLTLFEGEKATILVDVSTFTHEHLLILFRVLHDYKRSEDIVFLSYTSVKSYSCNEEDITDKWLTKGVKELRSIIGFPGYFDPTKRNHLIILVGFEVERVIKIIECFDFERVTLVVGAKGDSINVTNQIINEHRYDQILKLHSNANKLEISLTDPNIVKTTLLKYVSNYGEFNTVVAPMNNKISTLGVGYAAIENPDIQLFYMQANVYNTEGYSVSGNDFYLSKL